MSRLVRLYPSAWRARYGAEFEDVLALRPLSLLDRLDVIRGSFDAWLRPQIVGATVPERKSTMQRYAAVAAALAGAAFILTTYSLVTQYDAFPYHDTRWAGILFTGGSAALAAAFGWSAGTSRGMRAGAALAAVGVVTILGWPAVLLGVFSVVLGAIVAGASSVRDHVLPVPIAVLMILGGVALALFNTEDSRVWLLIPLGVACFALAAARLVARPAEMAV